MFCETRWVEKHSTIQDFNIMYEPLLTCLDAIACTEQGWDTKTVGEAYGLMKRITDSTCFQTVLHFFGYTKGLSCKLQGASLDIVKGYEMVTNVTSVLMHARQNEQEYDVVFDKMIAMVDVIGNGSSLEISRRCGRQTQRSNIPAETPKEYFRLAIYIPYLDSLLQQFNMRFGDLAKQAIRGLYLISSYAVREPVNPDELLHY